MATIYKRGTRWYLNYSEQGRQHRQSLGEITRQEAEQELKHFHRRQGGKQNRSFRGTVKLGVFAVKYLRWHRTEYPNSHKRINDLYYQWLDPVFGDRYLVEITPGVVEEYKVGRIELEAAPETVSKEIRTLKAMMNKAVQWGELDANQIRYVKPPRNLDASPPKGYTEQELARLKAASSSMHAAIWHVMAFTGMRRSEAQHLKWEHVNLTERQLFVVSTAGERTKSGEWRQIPISESCAMAFEVLQHETGMTPYVLPPMNKVSLSRLFARTAKRSGVDGSLHDLRHTFGFMCAVKGVPVRIIQAWMGHSTVVVTEQYTRAVGAHANEFIGKLE
jgi:integrase